MQRVWPPLVLESYSLAVGTVVLATLFTVAAWAFLAPMPFAFLFLAVMVSGWYGGLGPGVLATCLALVASAVVLFPPVSALFLPDNAALPRLGVFTLLALVMSVLNGARHDAAATLRESEAQYRLLFDSMNEGFCVVEMVGAAQAHSLDYRFRLVNPAFARLTGIAEAVGKRMREIAPLHEEYWFTTYEQVAVTGEARRFEYQAAQLQHCYDVHAFRVGAPAARTVAILFTDITARKQAEDRLRQSEQTLQLERDLLRVTLASIGDAVIATDTAALITFLNPVAERLTGWAAHEALGRPLLDVFPIVNEQTRQPVENPVATVLQEGRIVGLANHTVLLARDGREVPIDDSGAPIQDQRGQVYGAVLVFHDITARKQAQAALERQAQALQQAKAGLEQAVAERTAELQVAKEAAEDANRAKSEFLASISHELRTPLNAIIGFTGTLLMKLPGPLTSEQERQLQTVQGSARHLLSLINDLLDLARIEAGKVEVALEPVIVQDVVEEVAAALRPSAEQKGVQFVVAVPAVPVTVQADRRALSQILLNLVTNAIKFTDHGSVRLDVTQHQDSLPRLIEVRVTDTGIGISPEQQQRLFEAFVQGPGNSQRRMQGTGLGLYLSRKLAELLGGQLTCQSEVGKGSVFTLILPEAQ